MKFMALIIAPHSVLCLLDPSYGDPPIPPLAFTKFDNFEFGLQGRGSSWVRATHLSTYMIGTAE